MYAIYKQTLTFCVVQYINASYRHNRKQFINILNRERILNNDIPTDEYGIACNVALFTFSPNSAKM